jgi:iron complex transport system substrate-binding protein
MIAMEGMLLLGFGPRTPQAIAGLARLLHPEQAATVGL